MKATRLFTNRSGDLVFEVFDISLQQSGNELVAYITAAADLEIAETAPGHDFGWHNAPQKQFVVTIQGRIEVELPGGKKSSFGVGSILLAENTEGDEHCTRVVSEEPWRCIYIPI